MDERVNPYLNFEVMDKDSFLSVFQELMNDDQLFVYEDDHCILATCVVIRQKRRVAHAATIGTLATHPDFHGQGIGTRFMKDLLQKLKNEGIQRVDLYVEADNPVAQKFYGKLGFQLEGVLKKYFKRSYEKHYVDEHLMALLLK